MWLSTLTSLFKFKSNMLDRDQMTKPTKLPAYFLTEQDTLWGDQELFSI